MSNNTKLAVALIVGVVIGFLLSSTANSLLAAGERSKLKRSQGDARLISDALEKYRQANGGYPPISEDVQRLEPYLKPKFPNVLPTRDVYSRPYVVALQGNEAIVVCLGRNGFVARHGDVAQPPAR